MAGIIRMVNFSPQKGGRCETSNQRAATERERYPHTICPNAPLRSRLVGVTKAGTVSEGDLRMRRAIFCAGVLALTGWTASAQPGDAPPPFALTSLQPAPPTLR